MGADDNILSNKFLPFGKVRMGCLGKVRMGCLGEGQDGLSLVKVRMGCLGEGQWVILRGRLGGG